MVGRMIREAVENMIDDVKESIEEQGRQVEQARMAQGARPLPGLQPPPPAYRPSSPALPPSPSGSVPPAGEVPARAAVEGASVGETSSREAPARVTPPDSVEVDDRPLEPPAGDGHTDVVGVGAKPGPVSDAGVEPDEAVARLETDVEVARELYRGARSELREARRAARLAARDMRRDRRYERRHRGGVDGGR